jgi:hypothetical protein
MWGVLTRDTVKFYCTVHRSALTTNKTLDLQICKLQDLSKLQTVCTQNLYWVFTSADTGCFWKFKTANCIYLNLHKTVNWRLWQQADSPHSISHQSLLLKRCITKQHLKTELFTHSYPSFLLQTEKRLGFAKIS